MIDRPRDYHPDAVPRPAVPDEPSRAPVPSERQPGLDYDPSIAAGYYVERADRPNISLDNRTIVNDEAVPLLPLDASRGIDAQPAPAAQASIGDSEPRSPSPMSDTDAVPTPDDAPENTVDDAPDPADKLTAAAIGNLSVTDRPESAYEKLGKQHGRETPDFLDGRKYALTEDGGHISIHARRQRGDQYEVAQDRYGAVVKGALDFVNIREAFPDEWADIPNSGEVFEAGGLRADESKDRAYKHSAAMVEQNIEKMPGLLIPKGAKTGRLEDITVQAVDPDRVNNRLLKKVLGAHGDVMAGEDARVYLKVSGQLFQGSTVSKNRAPMAEVSSLVVATRALWGNPEHGQVLGPRVYTVASKVNDLVAKSRLEEAATVQLVVQGDNVARPITTGMGQGSAHRLGRDKQFDTNNTTNKNRGRR